MAADPQDARFLARLQRRHPEATRNDARDAMWKSYTDRLHESHGGRPYVSVAEQIDQANQRSSDRLAARMAAQQGPAESSLSEFERPHQPDLEGFPEDDLRAQKARVEEAAPGTINRALRETQLEWMQKAGRSR